MRRLVTVRLPDALVDRVDAVAAARGVTRTQVVEQALEKIREPSGPVTLPAAAGCMLTNSSPWGRWTQKVA